MDSHATDFVGRLLNWMQGKAGKRLEAFRRFLEHACPRIGLDLGFVLWDGSTVPAGLASTALAVSIRDEGVVAALVRRPNLDTICNLWAAARIDIQNGTILDVAQSRPSVRTKDIWRSLDKKLALSAATKFLFVPRGGPWPLESVGSTGPSDGDATENKRNIAYHYDLSNAFYALFLDPEMLYSCAYFTDWDNDLATAQQAKLEMICRKLRLQPGERLLDIGCGWGGLSCYAAQHYGVQVHGLTLSEQQHAYVCEKVARLGLGGKVTVQLVDYTAVDGQFDKIAQIEMFEHVGIANHPTFFRAVHKALKPGGLYLHQATTRPAKSTDRRFLKRPAEYAAITRYIFPGGELDHIGMSVANLERFGFEVLDVEAWREHFARTFRLWHQRLLANSEAAAREVGQARMRVWLAYLAGVTLAFERGSSRSFQTLAAKRVRGLTDRPPTRAYLYD